MSIADCTLCGNYAEQTNRNHPGYCSAECRDADRLERQQHAEAKRRKPGPDEDREP